MGGDGASCSIDDMESCTLADLEVMYVDALWNYYQGKGFTLTDDQYDQLKEELNWSGSGFPSLRRHEIKFVEAAMSYARGEPCVKDAEYEKLKEQVKAESGKRADVTALLLYTKGQQLLEPEQYDALSEEMMKLGIEVGMRGATCTLSKTPETIKDNPDKVALMYFGLGLAPSLISFSPIALLAFLPNFGIDFSLPLQFTIPAAALLANFMTYTLVNYVKVNNAQIITGQCPCCETELKQLFAGDEPRATSAKLKCPVCGTQVVMDREEMKIALGDGTSGPQFIGS